MKAEPEMIKTPPYLLLCQYSNPWGMRKQRQSKVSRIHNVSAFTKKKKWVIGNFNNQFIFTPTLIHTREEVREWLCCRKFLRNYHTASVLAGIIQLQIWSICPIMSIVPFSIICHVRMSISLMTSSDLNFLGSFQSSVYIALILKVFLVACFVFLFWGVSVTVAAL